ncbi:hypothetical protein MUS1_11830 [Marinomonas ushuaiensis DSM 15871]|uniref:Uncharacterized protein n=1 Tax=Marinomonas ushuaiensis DSM 15871 TaxID=1122207 RepID=X7E7M1_9GAMM|nr:hypothetical protein MUS1_11830 [Marinomonas ushuaiensis DSM 15871]
MEHIVASFWAGMYSATEGKDKPSARMLPGVVLTLIPHASTAKLFCLTFIAVVFR